jgi:hypothetical protein
MKKFSKILARLKQGILFALFILILFTRNCGNGKIPKTRRSALKNERPQSEAVHP